MPRDLTPQQLSNLQARATKPLYLIAWEYSGVEQLLSTGDVVVYDGQTYECCEISVVSGQDTVGSTLRMPYSPEAALHAQLGTWRGGRCKIWALPVLPGDQNPYDVDEGMLLLDGEIRSVNMSGDSISVQVAHRRSLVSISPRYTWDKLTAYCPAAGVQVVASNGQFVLPEQDGSLKAAISTGVGGSLRLTAAQIKAMTPPTENSNMSATGLGAPIAIPYGQTTLAGQIFVIGEDGQDMIIGVGWGFGELDAFEEIYLNGEPVSALGADLIYEAHYLGTTTQTVDPELAANIPAFNDDMVMRTPAGDVGAAYSVFTFKRGETDVLMTWQAVVRGRKVLDPRTSQTVYSNNPALCLSDFINNPVFGMNQTTTGVEACADWCDSLIDGQFVRCSIGLALTETRRSADYVTILAEYAECIWLNDGANVDLKPDKKVEADNPSGIDEVTNGDFTTDSDWFLGNSGNWSINTGLGELQWSSGFQQFDPATQDLGDITQEDSQAKFSLAIEVAAISGGTAAPQVSVFGQTFYPVVGTNLFSVQAPVVPEGAAFPTVLEIDPAGSLQFDVDSVSFTRLYYLDLDCVKGSLSITGMDDSDTPNKVSVRYTDPQSTTPNWPELIASASLPGVEPGDIPELETTISLPGVVTAPEAANKANARLRRMVNRVRVSWITTDIGVRHRRGDVINLRVPYRGVDILVLVDTVDLVAYGRYKVSGSRYDESQYPSEIELPAGVGTVPVGAICLLSGDVVPSGWEAYDDAEASFIVGAGGTYTPGDTGGGKTHPGFSGNTSTSSSHNGGQTLFEAPTYLLGGANSGVIYADTGTPGTNHNHSYSTPAITPDIYRRENRLVRKINSADTMFHKDIQVFGLAGLLVRNVSRITTAVNRLLMAKTASGNFGQVVEFEGIYSGYTSDQHTHHSESFQLNNATQGLLQPKTLYVPDASGGGSHRHQYNLNVAVNAKRRALALYGGSDDYSVVPGMMIFWAGSLGALPADWILCDGSNLTPDLRDYFIEIAPEGGEGVASGDNTLAISGTGSSVGHEHRGSGSSSQNYRVNLRHSNNMTHTHTISDSDTFVPVYYALAVLMYAP